jgi:hypothetical protein
MKNPRAKKFTQPCVFISGIALLTLLVAYALYLAFQGSENAGILPDGRPLRRASRPDNEQSFEANGVVRGTTPTISHFAVLYLY